MRHPGRVVSKAMIVSHVWDYSFDTGHQRRRRARAPAARQDRQGVRAQAPSYRARRGICPQGGVIRFRHAFAWRLGLWYAALFVVSAATLALVTYVLLARALAAQDHDVLAVDARALRERVCAGGTAGPAPVARGRRERGTARAADGPGRERSGRSRVLRHPAGMERLRSVPPRRAAPVAVAVAGHRGPDRRRRPRARQRGPAATASPCRSGAARTSATSCSAAFASAALQSAR